MPRPPTASRSHGTPLLRASRPRSRVKVAQRPFRAATGARNSDCSCAGRDALKETLASEVRGAVTRAGARVAPRKATTRVVAMTAAAARCCWCEVGLGADGGGGRPSATLRRKVFGGGSPLGSQKAQCTEGRGAWPLNALKTLDFFLPPASVRLSKEKPGSCFCAARGKHIHIYIASGQQARAIQSCQARATAAR